MGEEGFEPSRIATVDLETTSLTARTFSLLGECNLTIYGSDILPCAFFLVFWGVLVVARRFYAVAAGTALM